MKLALIILALLVIGFGALESALRFLFGFGNPLLYVADAQTGYRLAPNQRVKRFGKRIEINQYSMRGPAIAPTPEPQILRVLLLGDSIANGGWWTDQADILSVQIQNQFPITHLADYRSLEVLNASANSWGPRNELAYIAKFGTFQAHAMLLLINTDDLFAIAPNSVAVGRDRSYPVQRPPLAVVELVSRLQKPRLLPELEALHQEGGDRVGVNLEAIRQIHRLATDHQAKLLLAMTPLLREVVPPGSRDYEQVARDRLAAFATAEQIPYIDFLDTFQQTSNPELLYRDHIHLSVAGNALVSQILSQGLKDVLMEVPLTQPNLPDTLLDDPW